jgi:hypothetical protein
VIPRRLNFINRRFKTLCFIFIGVYKDKTECSETSVHIIQTPGNYPNERIQHLKQGENFKSWNIEMSLQFEVSVAIMWRILSNKRIKLLFPPRVKNKLTSFPLVHPWPRFCSCCLPGIFIYSGDAERRSCETSVQFCKTTRRHFAGNINPYAISHWHLR